MQTLFAFVVAIGVLVAVHEWGHYKMAVWCGVKVLKFSVGFGPRILGYRSPKSGTEFVIGAFPLGGYVKMLDEREGVVPAQELHRAFNTQSVGRRAAIVAAGPVANLILALVLYTCVNWFGVEQALPVLARPIPGSIAAGAGLVGGETVLRAGFDDEELVSVRSFEDVRWWLTRAALAHRALVLDVNRANGTTTLSAQQRLSLDLSGVDARHANAAMFRAIGIPGPLSSAVLSDLMPDGAAHLAGLQVNDVVLQVDGVDIADAAQLREVIRQSGNAGTSVEQSWLVQRQQSKVLIHVRPKVEKEGDAWIGRVGAAIGALPKMVTVQYGFIEGIQRSVLRTWEVSTLTLNMMGKMLAGQASLKNLSGPITIADYAGKSAALGFSQFLVFLALVSISLGVLNLLPLPVLDGGHLMYYLWELVTGAPVSEAWIDRLQRVGVALLLLMMSIAMFNDAALYGWLKVLPPLPAF